MIFVVCVHLLLLSSFDAFALFVIIFTIYLYIYIYINLYIYIEYIKYIYSLGKPYQVIIIFLLLAKCHLKRRRNTSMVLSTQIKTKLLSCVLVV